MPHRPLHPEKLIRSLACLALALAVLGPLATPAPALAGSPSGSFFVNTTGDTNVRDSVLSLREAILVANGTLTGTFTSLEQAQLGGCAFVSGNISGGCGDSVPDKIILTTGTYLLSIGGANENNSLTGDLDIFSDVAISGAGLGQTIIDAGSIDRAIDIQSGPVAISGVFIEHGSPPSGVGGGIRIQSGNVSLADGGVLSNTAANDGGGIHNAGILDLTAMTIGYNAATGGTASGGGIYNAGSLTALLADMLVSNTAVLYGGGLANTSLAMLADTAVVSNTSDLDGGGIYNSSQLTISNSYFTGNQAAVLGGGLRSDSGTVIVDGSLLKNNHAGNGGGLSGRQSTITVTNSSLISNTALSGGGLWVYSSNFWLTNVTISGNRADGDGGGIEMEGSFNNQVLGNNLTVANNTADADNSGGGDGGGLKVYVGMITLTNSILAGNLDLSGGGPDCSGTLDSGGYNLIQSTTGCTVTLTTGDLNLPAMLGALGDNGGSSPTQLPLPLSPAIDQGSPAAPGSGGSACAATDQRGVTRPAGAHCDIGAVEVHFKLFLPLVRR